MAKKCFVLGPSQLEKFIPLYCLNNCFEIQVVPCVMCINRFESFCCKVRAQQIVDSGLIFTVYLKYMRFTHLSDFDSDEVPLFS